MSSKNKVEVDGVVVEHLQGTRYAVEVDFQGMKHRLEAYPSGRMRVYYKGRIMVGDEVTVEVEPPYLEIGRIVRKLKPKKYSNKTSS